MLSTKPRGQLWSSDFLFSTMLILFLITFFILFWNSNATRFNAGSDYADMRLAGAQGSELLVGRAGDPPSWENLPAGEESRIVSIGLAQGRNSISPRKFSRLQDMNYTLFKQRTGLEPYEVWITLDDLENNQSFSFGLNATNDSARAAFSRFVLYNGSVSLLTLEVWQ